MKSTLLTLLFIALFCGNTFAQLTGLKTIDNSGGGDYLTFNAAVTDLNTQGVGDGGVTFNVIAGQTFSETPMTITATGSGSSPITFQRTGAGNNPVIFGINGTINTGLFGLNGDAIIKIMGGDFITFDGINLIDDVSNVTNTTRMEYGVMLMRNDSDTNASKNITIRNCKIQLNSSYTFTIGIYSSNLTTSNATIIIPSVIDTNKRVSDLRIYSDSIVNCYNGIVIYGIQSNSGFYDNHDHNIRIGEDGGNVITGFGVSVNSASGVEIRSTNNFFVSNNRIAGGNASINFGSLFGISSFNCPGSNCEIKNNEITVVKGELNSTELSAIYNAANGIVTISGNEVHGCFAQGPFFFSGIINLIYQYGSGSQRIAVYDNLIRNNSAGGINLPLRGINVNTINADSINIYNNVIRNNTHSGEGFAAEINGIIGKNIHHNKYYANTHNHQSGGQTGIIGSNIYNNEIYSNNNCTGIIGRGNIFNNQIYDLYVNSSDFSQVIGIFIDGSANIYNNFIANLRNHFSSPSSVGALVGIYINNYFFNGNINLYNNTVYLNSQMSVPGILNSHCIFYWIGNPSDPGVLQMKNNIFVNRSNTGLLGVAVAFGSTSDNFDFYDAGSDNNCFYVNSGENYFIYRQGAGNVNQLEISSIGAYRNLTSPREGNSFIELPPFVDIAGNDPNILTNVPTQLESGGIPVTSPVNITTDIFGNPRNPVTPDVGSVEFNGTPLDNDVEAADVTFFGTIYLSGSVMANFTSKVRNNSNQPRSFKVFRTVSPGGYSDSLQVNNLSSRKDTIVTFKNFPSINNVTYTITDSVYLSGDQIASNNVTTGEFTPTNPKTFLILNGHEQSKNRLIDAINEDGRFTESYDLIDIQNLNASLGNWKTVIVLFGTEWSGLKTWTSALRDSMKAFIDNSDLSDKKTLIVFGNSLGNANDNNNSPSNTDDTTFYRQYLKAKYLQTTWGYGGGKRPVIGDGKGGGDIPFASDNGRIRGLGSFSSITDDTTNTPWSNSDLISPNNGSTPVLIPFSESGDGDSCVAVVYGDIVSDYNTLYSSISFEYFKSEDGGGKFSTRGILSGASLIFDVLVDWVEEGEGALPVDLLSFTALVDNNDVTLSWETAWEENNGRFELYRKPHGQTSWQKIGTVSGSGNSSSVKRYSYTDKNLTTGKYEYQLKQFDYNGNSNSDWELNQIITIGIPMEYTLSQNYPNPFNPVTKINFQIPVEGMTKLLIYDMSGREVAILVNDVLTPGYYTYDFNASTLASGVYFYRLVTASSVITKRALLVK